MKQNSKVRHCRKGNMKFKLILLSLLLTIFCCTANAQSGRKSNQPKESQTQTTSKQEQQKEEKRGEIQPVKIIRRPAPDAKVAADCHRNEGFAYVKTVLRVTFDALAVISNVEVKTASGCLDFDEESIEAARGIKFEPAVQDGKPITVVKTVIYAGGIR